KWKHRHDEVGRLAETFDELLARLEEAFARERQFISDASHELKTPLTSINANAQMLVRWGDRDASVLRESLETIASESAALAAMIARMLTLAKADSGDSIPKEPLALNDIVSEAVHSAQQAAVEKGLSLAFEAAKPPSPVILGDAGLLRQLLRNLIENAVKFTPAGGIKVRVSTSDGSACIDVEDTGLGIDPVDLPYIFDRFYRADKSRSRDIGGTGLGLAIVRSIARIHDGSVEVESKNLGSTFRVRFPLLKS
ncbi:MAG: HAMP domain-containing histidine kinase, partial [Candidatus Eremiobacteraeota bacterium]|nr:HAMP domain-containing histidine kinase [Candidatus Eremiobacteraeota bacterium]